VNPPPSQIRVGQIWKFTKYPLKGVTLRISSVDGERLKFQAFPDPVWFYNIQEVEESLYDFQNYYQIEFVSEHSIPNPKFKKWKWLGVFNLHYKAWIPIDPLKNQYQKTQENPNHVAI